MLLFRLIVALALVAAPCLAGEFRPANEATMAPALTRKDLL
jgi:predicted cobalt transporter CbtA